MLMSIISRIIVTLLPIYLPIEDINLKITIGVLLGELLTEIVKYIGVLLVRIKIPYFYQKANYIKISRDNEIYDLLIDYYSDKYIKNIKAYNINEIDSKIIYTIHEFYNDKIHDTYIDNIT